MGIAIGSDTDVAIGSGMDVVVESSEVFLITDDLMNVYTRYVTLVTSLNLDYH